INALAIDKLAYIQKAKRSGRIGICSVWNIPLRQKIGEWENSFLRHSTVYEPSCCSITNRKNAFKTASCLIDEAAVLHSLEDPTPTAVLNLFQNRPLAEAALREELLRFPDQAVAAEPLTDMDAV